jgi:hypothetical protein
METKDYEKQGTDFLEKHGVKMTVKLLYNGPYFDDEKENRDIYQITLERSGKKPWSFRFGQSLNNSRQERRTHEGWEERRKREAKVKAPSAYDVLSVLEKYDPGTFSEFCAEFGYDTDSRKAEKVYFAIQEEYSNLRQMFSGAEINAMAEIQ